MTDHGDSADGVLVRARALIARLRELGERTLLWRVWERMVEIEFVDRGIALAGKAFVSFFPLVIVVAAFVPENIRDAIYTTLTNRLGIRGEALANAREAFATSDDIRKATGVLGLLLTVLFAASFTTALQRVYLRAWRRPRQRAVGVYARGIGWLAAMLLFMAATGAVREIGGDGPLGPLLTGALVVLVVTLWWFTAWLMLMGQVRWRALLPGGVATGLTMALYTLTARVWMNGVVERNQEQFGFFGVALSLVTWFTGAAVCVIIGACAGPVLAEDPGPVGRWIRGRHTSVLVPGAAPSLPGPEGDLRLRDAFRPTDDEFGTL